MSRNKTRITKLLNKYGVEPVFINWEKYTDGFMWAVGWVGEDETYPIDWVLGYNIEDVLNNLRKNFENYRDIS